MMKQVSVLLLFMSSFFRRTELKANSNLTARILILHSIIIKTHAIYASLIIIVIIINQRFFTYFEC